jgi:isopentenyl phosphate kinase
MNTDPLKVLMRDGCIPILRGDLASDINGGWSVVSGDEIMVEIVRNGLEGDIPSIDTAVMCLDIDGFYEGLGETDQSLLREIGPDLYHEKIGIWRSKISSGSKKGDVSGGVIRKVEACHRIASMNCDAWMVGGSLDVSLSKVLNGEHSGTRFNAFDGNETCQMGRCGQKGG